MTRHVFDNHMLVHVWAQQNQAKGRTSNGNLWFEGRTLYSYRTPIATIIYGVALISSERYSPTTGQHLSKAWQATSRQKFRVPYVAPGQQGRSRAPNNWDDLHQANLADLVASYHARRDALVRARNLYQVPSSVLHGAAKEARDYAHVFGLTPPELDWPNDAKTIMDERAKREAKRNDPKEVAKRERAAKRREEREAEKERIALLDVQSRLECWRNGETGTTHGFHTVPCALRVHQTELQTSWGASVPLEHAIRAFRFIATWRARANGNAWERDMDAPESATRVGHFTIDRINADGGIKAGCHTVLWPEIERIALQLGLLEDIPA